MTKLAMLIGAGVLASVLGVGGAAPVNAAINHHHRHARSHDTLSTPISPSEANGLSTIGNNPAKRYSTRHAPDGAVSASTLLENGNNPAKRYSARHAPDTALKDQTLMTNGNNPARKAAATASVH